MCLLAYAPKDRTQISNRILSNAYAHNNDAWGFMFPEGGRVQIVKDVTGFDHFLAKWKQAPRQRPISVHFRYATAGGFGRGMAHPFPVLEDEQGVTLAVAHNGVMSCVNEEPSASDTAVFVRDVLKPQLVDNPQLAEFPGWRDAMGTILGEANKLVFMRGDGAVFLVNGWQGKWHDNGVWYSNEYSLEDPKPRENWRKPGAASGKADFSSLPYFASYKESTSLNRVWPDDTDTAKPVSITRALEPLDAETENDGEGDTDGASFMVPDLWELTENEIYNWVAGEASPEDITDAILDMRGGR